VASEVRGVVIRGAVGGLGEDDEFFTSLEMQGLSAAWLPGDHGLCLVLGGGLLKGVPLEPALTIVLDPKGLRQLSAAFVEASRERSLVPGFVHSAHGTSIALGEPARTAHNAFGFGGVSAWVEAYKSLATPLPVAGRPFVLDIKAHPCHFRIYLTQDEVDDLRIVLSYEPPWLASSGGI
jgi:hypothetical protein